MVERVCPRCGRSSSEVPFIGHLCRDCYVEVYGVARLPRKVHFVYCQYCGRYKYQGGWNEPSGTVEETLRDYIEMVLAKKGRPTQGIEEFWIEKVELLTPFHGPGIYKARVVVAGRSGDVEAREEKLVEVKVDVGVCPMCTNRITKRGYNAIIQVRSSEGRLSEPLRRRVDRFLSEELSGLLRESVIGTEEHKEGFDILVSDPSSARMIASKLRAAFMGRTSETWKLVGRKPDGSRKGRLTILVRLPDIEEGDVIDIGGKPYLLLAVAQRGGPLLLDLSTGRETTMRPDRLWAAGFRRHPEGPETRKLMLIDYGYRSVVFMDPDRGYETIDIPRDRVHVFVEDLEPGRIYKVMLVAGRAYILRSAE